jgi:CRP-like cAMP-binding protein
MSVSISPSTSPYVSSEFQFSPRAVLPNKSGCLWKIEEGVVRAMSWLEDGTIVVLGVWGPGDLVGEALTQVEPYQLECITGVKATLLSSDRWQYNLDITASLLNHVKQVEEFLLIRSHRRIDATLLQLLSWLARKFGKEAESGQLIDLRLTHQDIAEMLGTTRVTITRVLSQLEQQGMIRRLPLHRIVLKEEELWHYEI